MAKSSDSKTLFVSMPASTTPFTPDHARGVIAKPVNVVNIHGVCCCMSWDGTYSALFDTIEMNREWMKLNGVDPGDYVQVDILNYVVDPFPKIVLRCRFVHDYQV